MMKRTMGVLALALVAGVAWGGFGMSRAFEPPSKTGLEKGQHLPPFSPQHVTGADRGTTTCPV